MQTTTQCKRVMRFLTVTFVFSSWACADAGDPGAPGDPDSAPTNAVDGAPTAEVDGSLPSSSCEVPGASIVMDIDATLTTSDVELVLQMLSGDHDPAMRPGGPALANAYVDRGYFINYLTGRGQDIVMGGTGESAEDATRRWLEEHGFPITADRTRLTLADSGLLTGDAARQYKAAALAGMQSEGFTFHYAYGNATSDIDAYADVGIPKQVTFIIGSNAGVGETVGVYEDGWVEHTAQHIPSVEVLCSFD